MKNTANYPPSPQLTLLNGVVRAQKATVAHFFPLQPLHWPTLACKEMCECDASQECACKCLSALSEVLMRGL